MVGKKSETLTLLTKAFAARETLQPLQYPFE